MSYVSWYNVGSLKYNDYMLYLAVDKLTEGSFYYVDDINQAHKFDSLDEAILKTPVYLEVNGLRRSGVIKV